MKMFSLLSFTIIICYSFSYSQIDLTSGLVAYYPLDSTTTDYSPFAIQGTIYGATPDIGKNNIPYSAFYFDGLNQYIDCSDNDRSITNKVSVSAWINKTTDLDCHIVNKYRGSNGTIQQGFHLAVQNGFPYFGGRLGQSGTAGYYYILADESYIMDGSWHHLLGTIDENEWNFWVDGYHIGSVTGTSSNPSLVCPEILAIGYYPEMQQGYFDGRIDEVRVYNRVLNTDEINLLADISFIDSTYVDTTTINISSFQTETDYRVYPNPGSEYINIKSSDNNINADLLIMDIFGRIILRQRIDNKTMKISVSYLSPGIYSHQIIKGNVISVSGKWIKM